MTSLGRDKTSPLLSQWRRRDRNTPFEQAKSQLRALFLVVILLVLSDLFSSSLVLLFIAMLLPLFPTLVLLALVVLPQTSARAEKLLGSSFGVPTINRTFDYVIVGGGTAGLAVAARLSEDSSNNVAVIEARSFYELTNGNLSEIPSDCTQFTGKDPNDANPLVD